MTRLPRMILYGNDRYATEGSKRGRMGFLTFIMVHLVFL
jgi:hypothetical protein